MNSLISFLRKMTLGVVCLQTLANAVADQDFTGDNWPDILWRYKNASDTWLWQVANCVNQAGFILPSTSSDWKIVGTGDFGTSASNSTPDGHADILWLHQPDRILGVWFFNGTTMTGGGLLPQAVPTGWEVAGAGDFGSYSGYGQPSSNQDGKADIVLQETSTDLKALWLMDGLVLMAGVVFDTDSPGWKIATVGDFGSSPSDPYHDGKPDLVYIERPLNTLSMYVNIQYMTGFSKAQSTHVLTTNGQDFVFLFDHDIRVVGAGNYTVPPGDSERLCHMDFLVRHHTDGRHWAYKLRGSVLQTTYPVLATLNPDYRHTYDTDYRMNTQELTDSVWRITNRPSRFLYGSAISAPPQISLTVSELPAVTYTIDRKIHGTPNFSNIASGWPSTNYTDTSVSPGFTYDYRISSSIQGSVTGTVALEAPPVHYRGHVLLAIEQNLSTVLGSDLVIFLDDLRGDGWTVEANNFPRHIDGSQWDSQNGYNAINLKSWITGRLSVNPNTKAVILLGHVTVPYSGTLSEGLDHGDHECPWAADLYYADALGTPWTMNEQSGGTNIGVGQFWNNFSPTVPELAVGRIDFARLPVFATPESTTLTSAEISLVRQYLVKNHKHRHKQPPFPLPDKAVFTTYIFSANLYGDAKINSAAFFGGWPNCIYVHEPFRNNDSFWPNQAKKCLWGFAYGNSVSGCIYQGTGLDYSSANIQQYTETPVAFWHVTGSYHADANMPNNLPRCILAKPSYSLAVIPHSHRDFLPEYRLEGMALGGTIGESFLFSIKNATPQDWHRWLNLQGDPTLRLHAISPPVITSASYNQGWISLAWAPGESGSTYYVYRADTQNDMFSQIGNTSGTSWTGSGPPNCYYMVRGTKLTSTGSGSYWNLSQGSIVYIATQ